MIRKSQLLPFILWVLIYSGANLVAMYFVDWNWRIVTPIIIANTLITLILIKLKQL